MGVLFLKILNMSITASWLVLAVIAFRVLLRKAPKWICAAMWGLVGIRLICPFSFESPFSLIPSAETVPGDILYTEVPAIHSGISALNSTVNPVISESLAPNAGASANPAQVITFAASVIWIVGIVLMVLYTIGSYLYVRKKVCEAARLRDHIWICDRIDTPFIFGVIRPRIYIPSILSGQDMEYVIAHEKAHLKRHDHWWKPLGFLLLTVYWFNPVLWIAYILFCRDIEFACDQKVISKMGAGSRKPYSDALINCSASRRMLTACPPAFGEVGVKDRIKSVLNYKKPAFGVMIAALVLGGIIAVCFLTNPVYIEEQAAGSEPMAEPHFAEDDMGMIYAYSCITDKDTAHLTLSPENQTFSLSLSVFSGSYFPDGTYEDDGTYVVLYVPYSDDKYTLKWDGQNLVFVAEKSSAVPKYRYSAGSSPEPCIADGAVFEFSETFKNYISKTSADIDGDGKTEDCILGYGPSSGVFTFTFSVYENDELEYFNLFTDEYMDLSFLQEADGRIRVCGKTQGKKEAVRYFEISIKDGNIVLSEGDRPFPIGENRG